MFKKIAKKTVLVLACLIIVINILSYFFPIGVIKHQDFEYLGDSYIEHLLNSSGNYVVDTEQKALKIAKSYMRVRDYFFAQPFEVGFDEKHQVWIISSAVLQATFLERFGFKESSTLGENILILIEKDGTVKYIKGI